MSPCISSNLPGNSADHALCPPIWSCSEWGLPCRKRLPVARCALTAPFHPYQPIRTGGLFSAALSVGSHPPGVTWHSVLWSPDFPPRMINHPARLPGQLPDGILHYNYRIKYKTAHLAVLTVLTGQSKNKIKIFFTAEALSRGEKLCVVNSACGAINKINSVSLRLRGEKLLSFYYLDIDNIERHDWIYISIIIDTIHAKAEQL